LAITAIGAQSPSAEAAGRAATTQDAPDFEFLVTTVEAGTKDADLDDLKCATSQGRCSLRAAIEQANAIPDGAGTVRIGVADGVTGTIDMAGGTEEIRNSDYMVPGLAPVSPADTQAYFHITRTMTIDLGNLVHVAALSLGAAAAFWVDAPDVQLLRFTDIYSNETSIVFGPNSDGSVLEGGESVQPRDYMPVTGIRVRPGADNITIRDYSMGLFPFYQGDHHGMILITAKNDPGPDPSAPVRNLTISNVVFDNTPAVPGSTACNATTAAGCDAEPIRMGGGIQVEGMVIENCVFTDMPVGRQALDFGDAGPGRDWDIRDNVFTRIGGGQTEELASIHLPYGKALGGVNYIRRNVMDNRGAPDFPVANNKRSSQFFAIRWFGPYSTANNTSASNLFIEDNYFNNYRAQTILLERTGAVTVRRNTFGTNSLVQGGITEETVGGAQGYDTATMLMNYNSTANRRILTWYPEAISAPVYAQCKLEVSVRPRDELPVDPKATTPELVALLKYNFAPAPVTLDFYWTAGYEAEVYLGSVANVSQAGTVTVPDIPPGAGKIRLQTQSAPVSGQPESSQFSRMLAVTAPPAECLTPAMSLELRAWSDLGDGASYSYEDFVGNPSAAEIEPGAYIPDDESIWMTYTVTNEGASRLRQIVVRDTTDDPVCVIPVIWSGETAGCSKLFRAAQPPHP
jgi:hypothetical protein